MELSVCQISPAIHFVSSWNNFQNETQSCLKHTCTYRLLFAKSGSCEIVIDGTQYRVPEKSVFFFLPGLSYVTYTNPNQKTEFLNIGFDIHIGERDLPQNAITNKNLYLRHQDHLLAPLCHFTDCDLLNRSGVLTVSPQSERLFDKIMQEKRDLHPLCTEMVNSYLHTLLLTLVRDAVYPQEQHISDAAYQIMQYVQRHITEPISNEQIAHALSYHSNYIGRVVKQATGMSLHRYVNSQKLHYAADLLLSTQNSITEIAQMLSFQSSSHFSNLFLKEFHCTPLLYRKMYT